MTITKEQLHGENERLRECLSALIYPKRNASLIAIMIDLRNKIKAASEKEVCSSIRYENHIRIELLDKIISLSSQISEANYDN